MTTFKISIGYTLPELKKAYAFYYGHDSWRKVNKKMVAAWIQGLAESDVDQDMPTALKLFSK